MSYCNWDKTSEANRRYHDEEWGVPVFNDDRHQFEHLSMEVMQCGLSWDLMINRRDIFRQSFDNFDFEKIAKYNDKDVSRIMDIPNMIRSPRKINAIINNAQKFIRIREEYGSFCNYLWKNTNGQIIIYDKHQDGYIPASNGLSEKISMDLKSRGFKYVGPVTIYSHLQSIGLIHDHDKNCPRHQEILSKYKYIKKCPDKEKQVKIYRDDN